MNGKKLSLQWLYLAWISIIFTILGFGIIGGIIQGDPGPFILKLGFGDIAIFALVLHAMGMIIAVTILYYLLRGRGIGWDAVGLKGKLSLKAVGYALVGVVVAFFLFPLIETFVGFFGVPMLWAGDEDVVSFSSSMDLVLTFVGVVALAPALEEILYRGYILTVLQERRSKTIALLLSALIFTSVHIFLGPGVMIYIFFWAFIPSLLYLKFRSLYPAILMHILNNFIAYIILPFLPGI